MFFNEVLTGLHFCQVEAVDFCKFGNEVRVKFDGVVIGMMRRELIVGFLQKDIHKISTPFRYEWFHCLVSLHNLNGDSGLVN